MFQIVSFDLRVCVLLRHPSNIYILTAIYSDRVLVLSLCLLNLVNFCVIFSAMYIENLNAVDFDNAKL